MKQFWKDTAERVISTFFQSFGAALVGVAAFEPVVFKHALTVAGLAAVICFCKCMSAFHFGEKGTASLLKKDD